jgi:hypothetical protein
MNALPRAPPPRVPPPTAFQAPPPHAGSPLEPQAQLRYLRSNSSQFPVW